MSSQLLTMSALTLSTISILFIACEPRGSGQNQINSSSVSSGATSSDSTRGPHDEVLGTRAAIEDVDTTLHLTWSPQAQGRTEVSLSYHVREGQVAPRTAEIFISHPPELRLVTSEKGAALQSVMKDLIVQEHAEGVLRVVIMSLANLNTLESGVLARFVFEGGAMTSESLFIQERRRYFAPADANIGVTLGTTWANSRAATQNLREAR